MIDDLISKSRLLISSFMADETKADLLTDGTLDALLSVRVLCDKSPNFKASLIESFKDDKITDESLYHTLDVSIALLKNKLDKRK